MADQPNTGTASIQSGIDALNLQDELRRLHADLNKERERMEFHIEHQAQRARRLWQWAHEELSEPLKTRYFNIVANGTADWMEQPVYAQQFNMMKHRAEAAEQERNALRAGLSEWVAANAPGGWIDALRAELDTAKRQEPVGYIDELDMKHISPEFEPRISKDKFTEHDIPLYAAPIPAQAPAEPTPTMISAGTQAWGGSGWNDNTARAIVRSIYLAMIAAAQTASKP